VSWILETSASAPLCLWFQEMALKTRNAKCGVRGHMLPFGEVSQLPRTHGHDTTRARARGRIPASESAVHWACWLSVHTREYECMHPRSHVHAFTRWPVQDQSA